MKFRPLHFCRKHQTFVRRTIYLSTIAFFDIVFGVMSNTAFWFQGQAMGPYSSFLLYFSCLTSLSVYSLMLGYRHLRARLAGPAVSTEELTIQAIAENAHRPAPTRGLHKHYFVLACLLTVNGTLSQYADEWVGGTIQSLLNEIGLPLTAVLAFFLLKQRFTVFQLTGGAIVLGGTLLGAIPALFAPGGTGGGTDPRLNSAFWLSMYALAILPIYAFPVLQQWLFTRRRYGRHTDALRATLWPTFYTLLLYVALLPLDMIPYFGAGLTWPQLWQNQADAWRCFFGMYPLPAGCARDAWLSVTLYCIGGMGQLYFDSWLVEADGAVFSILVQAIIVPISSIVFSLPVVLGSKAVAMTWYTIAGTVIVPIGVIVFKSQFLIPRRRTALVATDVRRSQIDDAEAQTVIPAAAESDADDTTRKHWSLASESKRRRHWSQPDHESSSEEDEDGQVLREHQPLLIAK
eukprot:TRINITY_DN4124_c0_g1_i1.p1 TRINITY_DN4124_c0_g1~~TRINITY_DN4124_c0_g1_i1.p1  ORF type:complete len:461 (-),score=80.38 TRINITY_DN4124_c0_g1_i1:906-2288(-)